MTDISKATPRPWVIRHDPDTEIDPLEADFTTPNNYLIGTAYPQFKWQSAFDEPDLASRQEAAANAALIVQTVNAFDDLVDLLECAQAEFEALERNYEINCAGAISAIIEGLAKAKSGAA